MGHATLQALTASLAFATGALARGGRVVITGLLGGTFSMPSALFALKAIASRERRQEPSRRRANCSN